jgi:hypothetical protein
MFGTNEPQPRHGGTKRSRLGFVARATFGLAAACSAATASAEDHAFSLRAGAILADVDTRIRVDPVRGDGIGADLDLEDDLGLRETPDIGFVEGGYRFAPRWKINYEYITLSRNRSVSLARDIAVGDTVFPVAATVSGSFASRLYKAHVTWFPVRTDQAEIGLSLGAHVTEFRLVVEGEGTIGNVAGGAREERREVTAPLPNLGISGSYEVIDRVRLSAKANYLQLEVDELTGGLTDFEASVAYEVTENFAIGAGYRSLGYRLDVERERFEGKVRYEFEGPFAFVMASF